MLDIGRDVKAVDTLPPAAYTAQANKGAAVDCKGFHEALVVFHAGAVGQGGTIDVKVQESVDTTDGNFADITGAAFTQVTASNDEAIYQGRIALTPTRKRYLRAVATVGTATSALGVAIILGEPDNKPAVAPEFNVYT